MDSLISRSALISDSVKVDKAAGVEAAAAAPAVVVEEDTVVLVCIMFCYMNGLF